MTPECLVQNWKVSREAPATPTRGRDRVGRGGLEGVDHPLHGWGCLRGRGFALPLHGESMRGGKALFQRTYGRSIRSDVLPLLPQKRFS